MTVLPSAVSPRAERFRSNPAHHDAALQHLRAALSHSLAGGGPAHVVRHRKRGNRISLEVHDGAETQAVTVTGNAARFAAAQDGDAILLSMDGQIHARRVAPVVEAVAGPKAAAGGPRLLAPMPGLVVAVEVAPGDRVAAGQAAVTMEAMKVVMRLPAPVAGRILRVACARADTVQGGDLLIEIESDGDA